MKFKSMGGAMRRRYPMSDLMTVVTMPQTSNCMPVTRHDVGVTWVGRLKLCDSALRPEPPARKFTLDRRDDHIAVGRRNGTVDEEHIAIVDAGLAHRST